MTQIVQRYGNQVLINLLGCKESEVMLSQMFQVCIKIFNLSYVVFFNIALMLLIEIVIMVLIF